MPDMQCFAMPDMQCFAMHPRALAQVETLMAANEALGQEAAASREQVVRLEDVMARWAEQDMLVRAALVLKRHVTESAHACGRYPGHCLHFECACSVCGG